MERTIMSLPNIPTLYERTRKGSEGGLQFARFVNELLIAQASVERVSYQSVDDSSGDFRGLDSYHFEVGEFDNIITGYQFKFFPSNLSSNHKVQIKKSLQKAVDSFEVMENWILITPEDWSTSDLEWFETLKTEFEYDASVDSNGLIRTVRFRLLQWGHSKLVELALKHPHIGRHGFPDLFKDEGGLISLAQFKMNIDKTVWKPSKHRPNEYVQYGTSLEEITSDPVFDVQILNNTSDTFILQEIALTIEEAWTTLKGIPDEYRLKSIGSIEFEINSEESVSVKTLTDPLIVRPKEPLRFDLQLLKFYKKVKHNWVTFNVEFRLNNGARLRTNSITLSF